MSGTNLHATSDDPVGLLAGWGRLPIVVARALRRQGRRVCCLGVKDHASEELTEICDAFQWIGLARLGAAVRFFRHHEVRQATMAGKFHKTLIYQKWAWLKHLPDLRFVRTFYPHFISLEKDRQDDTLLNTLVEAFAVAGIRFLPAVHFEPDLLVGPGSVTPRRPTTRQQKDIEFGWHIAKQMGGLDIGQSVCVKDLAVLAVEAIEGTDQCIRRAGSLCAAGGFCVVKVAKPQQDMRFDVPTVGNGTLEAMAQAGASLLAVEASRTILLDRQAFVEQAMQRHITVVAVDAASLMRQAA